MWADPNLKQFQGRLKRIEKAHGKGYGFEARGTLGRSSTYRRERSLGRILRGGIVVLAIGFTLKGAIHFHVGEEAYQSRVAEMEAGTGVDPFAARLMSADPLTRLISAFLKEVFPPKVGPARS
ncbi:hypothetical protein [Pseudogemmobacter sonorensis]|uniref:hypothetical protein n=1 Tax=Pseudogemmobacter sonorensis TaxID=2989681 RepID=UPI0036A058F3